MKFQANPKIFMGLAALALVGGGLGSYSQWNKLTEIESKADGLRAQMRDPVEVQKQLEESGVKLSESAIQLSHLEKGVPSLAYMATLLGELDEIGTKNGIDVLGVRPMVSSSAVPMTAQKAGGETAAKERKPYQELNIEIKGRGDYKSVLNFVRALQTFPKIVAARTVSITPKLDDKKTMRLDITIELRAFLFPTPRPAGLKAMKSGEETPNNG